MTLNVKVAIASGMTILSGVCCGATPAEGLITYWVVLIGLYAIEGSPRD